jgi:hypothetical protein
MSASGRETMKIRMRCRNGVLWSEWRVFHGKEIHVDGYRIWRPSGGIPEYGRTWKGFEEAIQEWITNPMAFGIDLEVHIVFHIEV